MRRRSLELLKKIKQAKLDEAARQLAILQSRISDLKQKLSGMNAHLDQNIGLASKGDVSWELTGYLAQSYEAARSQLLNELSELEKEQKSMFAEILILNQEKKQFEILEDKKKEEERLEELDKEQKENDEFANSMKWR